MSALAKARWYARHKDEQLSCQKQRRKEIKDWFHDLKSRLSCTTCGEDHPACLQFHHREKTSKFMSISQMVRSYNKEGILKEMEKCDVICANCHFKLHACERDIINMEKSIA